MAKVKIAGIKGMNDMLPADAPIWEKFETAARETAASYGYRQIRTPILEATQLFCRGIGEVTDIVEKEMYSFTDSMNGEQLTLRPENTSAVVRAAIEHNLTYGSPQRLWYFGPMFRHERPQRGRDTLRVSKRGAVKIKVRHRACAVTVQAGLKLLLGACLYMAVTVC